MTTGGGLPSDALQQGLDDRSEGDKAACCLEPGQVSNMPDFASTIESQVSSLKRFEVPGAIEVNCFPCAKLQVQ